MHLKSFAVILCLSFLIASSGIGQEPQLLTKPGLIPELYGVLEKPDAPGTYPAVVILYGSQGWRPIYATIAKSLADSGFVALALDYYAYQGDDSSETGDLAVWHRWQAAVRSAVAFLMEDPSVKKGSVGLLGYSLGAILSVSVASSIPGVKTRMNWNPRSGISRRCSFCMGRKTRPYMYQRPMPCGMLTLLIVVYKGVQMFCSPDIKPVVNGHR
jgi:hypothetical protein